MKITNLLINHQKEPIGFDLSNLRVDFIVEADKFERPIKKITIWTSKNDTPVFEKETKYDNNFFDLRDLKLLPRTRYYVQVDLTDGDEHCTATTFFETGKMNESFTASWITNKDKGIQNTLFKRDFSLNKTIASARLYISGLGLYEASLNGEKIGDEFLTPGVTAYDHVIQVQTYDVTEYLKNGTNTMKVSTADGWYKGNYGFDGGKEKIYGDHHQIIAELHIKYDDGTEEQINTDGQWLTTQGPVTKSSIYYGEDLDGQFIINNWQPVELLDTNKELLSDRLSLPLKIMKKLPVKETILTPNGETVLDFGQNQAGWPEFYCDEPAGTTIKLEAGEILQKGNFYRGNLREARAAFVYTSDGKPKWVRPHFTYMGYRYLRVTGLTQPIKKDNFKADVIYSAMSETGNIETENPLVNRLFKNIQWGQKSNFFDVPTDCPQRDERLGWTGDANIFSNTAALNMNVFAFFKKYARDMAYEQKDHNGMLTMYAPKMGEDDGGAAVWGDAATFIPWNMYQNYGDDAILKQNYTAMKSWVDWITDNTKTDGLWTGCFQFGDWIALDGENPALPTGKTDEDYIASVYYYASTKILSETAKHLNKVEDATKYNKLAGKIYNKIRNEYITPNGKLSIDTQTAYALALYFNLVPDEQKGRVTADLVKRLNKDNDHLKTGFVGTPFINQVLSENGEHELATKIFLQEDYPSWLYAVKMGATTVWERWNSVLEDGSMNPDGMNSLNHYSIGAIMEWAYKYVLGIKSKTPGYQEFTFEPHFDYRLKKVNGHYFSPYGDIKVSYQIESNPKHLIKINLEVPFGTTAHIKLPRSKGVIIKVNDREHVGDHFKLTVGKYKITYIPAFDYIGRYKADTPINTILADNVLQNKIDAIDPVLTPFEQDAGLAHSPLAEMSIRKVTTINPSINIAPEKLDEVENVITHTVLPSER